MKRLPAYLRVLSRLNRARVPFLLYGVTGINHYARDTSESYSTQDCDILLKPVAKHLAAALDALKREGYDLQAGGEPLPWPDPLVARRLVQFRAVVRGFKARSLGIDLMSAAPGTTFEALWKRRCIFRPEGVRVACAPLEDLLASKERAGRPKDKAFLALYYANLGTEYPAEGRSKRVRGRR